jgi:hypothetical protein
VRFIRIKIRKTGKEMQVIVDLRYADIKTITYVRFLGKSGSVSGENWGGCANAPEAYEIT